MSPPSGVGKTPPALTVVPSEPTAPAAQASASVEASSTAMVLASPDAALTSDLLNKGSRFSPYEYVADVLKTLANPMTKGGYDVSFERRQLSYRLLQRAPGAPIELIVSKIPANPSEAVPKVVLHLVYFSSGEFQSSKTIELHSTLDKGELIYHRQLQDIIQTHDTTTRTYRSMQIYNGLRTALEGLKPRYSADTQSAWYDHFAVYQGRVYSFRIKHMLGPPELMQDPRLKTIDIFEATADGGQTHILSLAASGENVTDKKAGQLPTLKEPLSHDLIALMEGLAAPLEEALKDPGRYRKHLGNRLRHIPWAKGIEVPNIAHPVKIDAPKANRHGSQGEPILEISKGWDLVRNLRPGASHRWENPQVPGEVRYLRPRLRIKFRMFREWLHWNFKSAKSTIGDLRNPTETKGRVTLHLFPDGGGQLNVYRFNKATQTSELYDILIGAQRGPHWRAGREVRALEKSGASFPSRLAALQKAIARRDHPVGVQVQSAPHIDLDQVLLDSKLKSLPNDGIYRDRSIAMDNPHTLDATATWKLIADALPADAKVRTQFYTPDDLLHALLPTPGKVSRVEADFIGSEPPLRLTIQQQDISEGEDGKVRRMEIVMRRGDDLHVRVFENGVHRPELARDISQRMLLQARQGRVPRSSLTLGFQALPRLYTFYKNNGNAYVASYFFSLPLVLGFERFFYSPGEWKLLHSKIPDFRHPLHLAKDVLGSFTLVTTAAGLGSVMIDGAYNMAPGLRSCWQAYRGEASFFQAYRNIKPTFYNESTLVRPLGGGPFRGFFQRAVPLFTGVAAMDFLHSKQLMSPMFWPNMINVSLVSAGSSLLLRGVYSSPLSGVATRAGLMEAVTEGGVSRFSLTLRGSLLIAGLEMLALGVLSAYERRAMLKKAEDNLRSELGNSLDTRNELITRLEQGEDIPPSELVEADQNVQHAQTIYRRFMELDERNHGNGSSQRLPLDNDFSDEYFGFEASQISPGFSDGDGMGVLEIEHRQKLAALRAERAEQKEKLKDVYRRHGIKVKNDEPHEAGFRELVAAQHQGTAEGVAAEKETRPIPSPIAMDSPRAQDIFAYLRWKASEDPQFLFLDPREKARCILKQFRLWIPTPEGGSRRWTMQDTLAFLREAQAADMQATANMKPSLLLPSEAEQMRSETIDQIIKEQAELRAESAEFKRHGSVIAHRLARNIPDFDRQMEDYLQESNARMTWALEKIVGPEFVARLQGGAENSDSPATAIP